MPSALDALNTLKKGNEQFVANKRDVELTQNQSYPGGVIAQKPMAIILSCSDSRVPPELIFSQGFGSLFVVRVAGNVAAPSGIGSIEFAVQSFKTPLVVVLGHSNCGAVAATIKALNSPNSSHSPNLQSIVDRVGPAVSTVLASPPAGGKAALNAQATRANVSLAANRLRNESVLQECIARNELMVVGAEYSLETGFVDFFDETSA